MICVYNNGPLKVRELKVQIRAQSASLTSGGVFEIRLLSHLGRLAANRMHPSDDLQLELVIEIRHAELGVKAELTGTGFELDSVAWCV